MLIIDTVEVFFGNGILNTGNGIYKYRKWNSQIQEMEFTNTGNGIYRYYLEKRQDTFINR